MGFQKNRKFLAAYSTAWVLWIFVYCSILFLFHLPTKLVIVDSISYNISNALFGYAIISTLSYYRPSVDKLYILAIWTLIHTVFVLIITWIFHSLLLQSDTNYENFYTQTFVIRSTFTYMILGVITLSSWVYYTNAEQKLVIHKLREAEDLKKEAELASLRQQMQPHFLFNSLNSINALIGKNPQKAREMVIQLSDFLRGTLQKELGDYIPLRDELEHLRLYLSIEKVRFGDRLEVVIDFKDEVCGDYLVPGMVLQPILENAIKFGLYGTTEKITIAVVAKCVDNVIHLSVSNPYDAESEEQTGTGFGLTSTQRRLFLLYKRTDLLYTKYENGIFTTHIKIYT